MSLTPFKNLIKNKTGLTFKGERSKTLEKGIRERIAVRGLEFYSEYFDLLFRDGDELLQLMNLLTINETYFYREPDSIKLFSERLVPELMEKKKGGEQIKILSAGCSTGEEAYSLVIALLEKYGRNIQGFFFITAVDIDNGALRKAKDGVFSRKSFRKFDANLKKKYFNKLESERYQVKDFVKNMVEFRNFNLSNDSFCINSQKMDIIFYRYVSIYFEPETQRKVFEKLAKILPDMGYLLLSSTETFLHNLGILSLVEQDGVFLYQKKANALESERKKKRGEKKRTKLTLKRKALPFSSQPPGDAKPPKEENSKSLFHDALILAKHKNYKDALESTEKLLKENPDLMKANYLKASILMNLNKMEEAKKICAKMIKSDKWNLESYLILGLVAKIENNIQEAQGRFKEALYIQPACWPAHFYMAELCFAIGELERACREYEVTIKLLEKGNISRNGFTLFPLSFSREQLIQLCRSNLTKLKDRLD